MSSRLRFVAVAASLCTGTVLSSGIIAADQPNVGQSIAKPLQAAQEAIGQKHIDDALTHVKEAQRTSGAKTRYDKYVINVMLIQIYQGKGDTPDLVNTVTRAAQSQYANTDQQKTWYKFIAQYDYKQKDYPKSVDAAEKAMRHGATDSDTMGLLAKAQYLSGKYKDAEQTQADIVGKQEKPDEDSLKLMWLFALKAHDDAAAAKALEKLAGLYPKPEVRSECSQYSPFTPIYAAPRINTEDLFPCCTNAVTIGSLPESIWRSKLPC
jgi:hypothetical protein